MNNKLTEKDLMHDLIASEKQVISGYSTGITETSCTNLRDTLVTNFKNAQDTQYKVFDAMRQKGWYQIKDAQDADVQKAKDDANTMANELI